MKTSTMAGVIAVAVLAARAGTVVPLAAPGDINLTAFANGALVESVTSDYGDAWAARWITDENPT